MALVFLGSGFGALKDKFALYVFTIMSQKILRSTTIYINSICYDLPTVQDSYWQLPDMLNAELRHAVACTNEVALSDLFMTFMLIKRLPFNENARSAMEFITLFALNQSSFDHPWHSGYQPGSS